MIKLLTRFVAFSIWIKVIFAFCLLGAIVDGVLVARDIAQGGILLRLHLGFFVLYVGQLVFIVLEERQVWLLAALQGVLALLTSADFTFMPLVRFVGSMVYFLMPEPSLEYVKAYRYVLVSASFTLQMLSAFMLFALLPPSKKLD